MTEFELDGQNYRAVKLSAFQQFHLSRKIAPLLPPLIPAFLKVQADGSFTKDLGGLAVLLQPVADALAALKDDEAEYILATCLGAVQRQTGKNWAPVWNKSGNVCMFDDLELPAMLQLSFRVIQDSLGPFISGALTSQTSAPTSAF